MSLALQAPYEVLDAKGRVIASGTIGDEGVELAPGKYRVQTLTTPPMQGEATVVSDKQVALVLK
jgi:hypothetical protein